MAEIVRTQLEQVHTFPLPPAGFVPQQGTAADLQRFGIPARPDPARRPQLAATWDRVFSRPKTYITPQFVHLADVFPGVRPSPRGLTTDSAGDTSNNWSGSVAFSTNDPFQTVIGSWTVADVYRPPGTTGAGTWYEVSWVGMDGWNSDDVCQVGTVAEVQLSSAGDRTVTIYAWWEWYPNDWVGISNFPVSAGDVLTCALIVKTSNYAVFNLVNDTSGYATALNFTPPQGTTLTGNCAEWIVERPGINGQLAQLPDYGWIYFDECSAATNGGKNFDPGQGTLVDMLDNSGNITSVPTIETPSLMKVNFGPKAQ